MSITLNSHMEPSWLAYSHLCRFSLNCMHAHGREGAYSRCSCPWVRCLMAACGKQDSAAVKYTAYAIHGNTMTTLTAMLELLAMHYPQGFGNPPGPSLELQHDACLKPLPVTQPCISSAPSFACERGAFDAPSVWGPRHLQVTGTHSQRVQDWLCGTEE